MVFACFCFAQNIHEEDVFDLGPEGGRGLRIMFYNVENLFDTFDDPAKEDDQFTSKGEKNWNHYRYKEKLNNIAKTIIAVGGWEPPDIVGLCEVENLHVLLDLVSKTPLRKFGYRVIHKNSPDPRGIDNALLYLPDKLEKINSGLLRIGTIGTKEEFLTRDILHASFSFMPKDTIQFFVNHWPSRFGGKSFSEHRRIEVANALKVHIDSIQSLNREAKLILMGDFNDEPGDPSISDVLNAQPLTNTIYDSGLYNLSYEDYRDGKGTITYKDIDVTWYLFDQIIVSGALINGRGLKINGRKNHIFKADWLIKNGRPFRAYQAPIYRGGFSDHLPIFLDLYYSD